jgi:GAF domain-containing protein
LGGAGAHNTHEVRLRLLTPVFVALAVTAARDVLEGRHADPEHAALRRVATLVAGAAPPDDIFAAVVAEVGGIFDWPWVGLMRYEADGHFVVLATWGNHPFAVGSRWPLDGPSTFESVWRTGQPARIADYEGLPGTVAEAARTGGIIGGVGAPIVVNGATWGVIAAPLTVAKEIPEGAEIQLSRFTELVAVAIANAESRGALARLADEQAALRRVATIAARESSPDGVFEAVADEAVRVLEVEAAGVLRFEADETAILVAQSQTPWDPPPLGTRFALDGDNLVATVHRTGEAARMDDWSGATGAVAAMAEVLGVRSSVATPIIVEGRLWGTLIVATSQLEPLPVDTELRTGKFTELVATAIANAESRAAQTLLVDEQAALRRVAMLVASQAAPDEIYAAVAEEIARLLRADRAAVGRYEPDDTLTVTAYWSTDGTELPVGTRIPLDGDPVTATVRQSGRPIRIETFDELSGPLVDRARAVGPLPSSTIGAPILVNGKAWGIVFVSSMKAEPLADDAESRVILFTELVATALANAQARDELRVLVEEQAALRRVATLVAKESGLADVLARVAEELVNVLGEVEWSLVRDDGDGSASVIAASERNPAPAGSRVPLVADGALGRAINEGSPVRVDDFFDGTGEAAQIARKFGIRAVVSYPIVVRGQTWGGLSVGSREADAFSSETETLLGRFNDLVATAIANSEARGEAERLADEQAALQRVAELVAGGISPEELFRAVAVEVGGLFGSDVSAVVRFDDDGMATVLGDLGGPHERGKRVTLDPGYVVHTVRESSRSARFDTDDPSDADLSSLVRTLGVRSAVASPIVVEGALWGAITAASLHGPLASRAEQRLNEFTGLVATAIANTQAREQVTMLAEEQAALRRVATLVAEEASEEEILSAIAAEIGPLIGIEETRLVRFVDDRSAVTVASSGSSDEFPVGERIPAEPGDRTPVARVLETGKSVRFDDYSIGEGPVATTLRRMGIRTGVCAPIYVDGRLWGSINTGSEREELTPDAESRLAQFTDLLATAIANTESRAKVARLADEQAALRRVATLVARGASAAEVFDAVGAEMGRLFAADAATLSRYESDDAIVVLAHGGLAATMAPVGTRFSLTGENVASTVRRTQGAARIEDYAHRTGPIAELMRENGVRSTVGVPIVVDGEVWAVASLHWRKSEPPPADTEERMVQFAELLGTAIANTQAREQLATLADEQAALRRVATLVAYGARPLDLFAAVAKEVGLLHAVDHAYLTRFDSDDTVTAMARWTRTGEPSPVTLPQQYGVGPLTSAIRRSRGPVRLDPYSDAAAGDLERGLRSSVAAPIIVEGKTWGMIGVSSMDPERPPSPGTEERLTKFTDLAATAIANADSREALALLADEQAALRRVATLVAEGVAPSEIFEAVSKEVQAVLRLDASPTDVATVVRFDPGPECVLVGMSKPIEENPLGDRWEPHDAYVSTRVLRTGRSSRVDEGDLAVEGSEAAKMRRQGYLSQVASPIVVDGRLWGAVTVSSVETLPTNTEDRLEKFTEIVATAIANAESRTDLAEVLEEQTALRRLATLVAEGVPSAELFSAVTREVVSVFSDVDPGLVASIVRFDPGHESVLVGASRAYEHEPLGARWTPKDLYVSTRVRRTGRSARVDEADLDASGGPDADMLRLRGFLYQVGSPVAVEGELWGAMCLNSSHELPRDTDDRLASFVELIATAIANAESRSELAASRRRIVAASDEARRRIERDLHDGMQQRLVTLGLVAGSAEADRGLEEDDLRAELSRIASGLAEAVENLQELSRGIHPAVLSDAGLGPALETLALRSTIPVRLEVATEERFPEPIEIATYFVASEALANVAKHAQASRVDVVLRLDGDRLRVSIRDDGVGGVDPARGSGLVGLIDRVEALGGSLDIRSEPGTGTQLVGSLPLKYDPSRDGDA